MPTWSQDVITRRVVGQYLYAQSVPGRGTITFAPTSTVYDLNDAVILSTPIVVPLDATGSFSVDLPTTDNRLLSPLGWAYEVLIRINGVNPASYRFFLPIGNGSDIDLFSELARLVPSTPGVLVSSQPPARGPIGPSGAQGVQGTQGTQGAQGLDGQFAAQGVQGRTGAQGTTGSQGTTGAQGVQGTIGLSGLDGDNYSTDSYTTFTLGNTGTQVIVVATGLSYSVGQDIVVANSINNIQYGTVAGYNELNGELTFLKTSFVGSGTYSSWSVNLAGAIGIQGVQGPTGAQGIIGTQGLAGTQGEVGAQGTTGTQGHIGTQGALGVQGTQGTQGSIGTQGRTGTQGAVGTQGTQGTLGLQGVQGTQGTQGALETSAVPNVLYVAKNGNDLNDGTSLATPKLTIKAALAVAAPDTAVYVKSGDYTEENPVTVPAKVSVIGDSARTTTVRPLYTNQDIFYVSNASYITGLTFKDHVSPAAAIAYNPNGSAGVITQSPYVFDCSSYTTTGTGMRIDGSVVGGGKSMLAGQFTQINLGGIGIHIINKGYAQLIAIYTICCDVSVLCESGGFCSLIGSDTSFGNYGLKASGVSEVLYTGIAPDIAVNANQFIITNLPHAPYVNNVVSFDDGTTYYAIDKVTAISSGTWRVTIDQRISIPVVAGSTARFYQASRIMAANHTFEYCGSGIDLINSRPQFGGVPIQENEIVQEFGGQIYYTSTDQKGDFRIGAELKIDRGTGSIEGIAFDRSLFAVMTPYILAIEG